MMYVSTQNGKRETLLGERKVEKITTLCMQYFVGGKEKVSASMSA